MSDLAIAIERHRTALRASRAAWRAYLHAAVNALPGCDELDAARGLRVTEAEQTRRALDCAIMDEPDK